LFLYLFPHFPLPQVLSAIPFPVSTCICHLVIASSFSASLVSLPPSTTRSLIIHSLLTPFLVCHPFLALTCRNTKLLCFSP
jgi:hypothetical protein